MIKNLAMYLSTAEVDWAVIDPSAEVGEGFVRFHIGGQDIRLNLMPEGQIPEHLAAMSGYLTSLTDDAELITALNQLILTVRLVVGVKLSQPISWQHEEWAFFEHIAKCGLGFFFIGDSVMLPGGQVLIGPLANKKDEADDQAQSGN